MDIPNLAFHEKVKAVRPELLIDPATFWVGVLLDSATRTDAEIKLDTIWFKCRGHNKLEEIQEQYLIRYPHLKKISLRHDGIPIEPSTQILLLDFFNDNVIALQASPESDLHSRMSAPQRHHLQPTKPNSTVIKKETEEMKEPSFLSPGKLNNKSPDSLHPDKNHTTFLNFSTLTDLQRRGFIRPAGLYRKSQIREATQMSSEQYSMECGMRDFIHEKLAELHYHDHPTRANPSIEIHRAELVDQWNGMSTQLRDTYKRRAAYFTHVWSKKPHPSLSDLIDFTKDNAGFHQIFFAFKGSKPYNTEKDFITVKDIWCEKKPGSRKMWIDKGQLIRHTSMSTVIASSLDQSGKFSEKKMEDVSERQSILDTPLSVEPAASEDSNPGASEQQVPQQFSLQKLFVDSTPELLEAAVKRGAELLEKLKEPLSRVSSDDASQWLPTIENLQKQAEQPKTIVGVVGNTGAGKSSVINAMLDEERLVPTNCMRACTAVVTEISYNYTEDPYRAEIEFITKQDWEKELRILFHDLLDGNGNVSREATNEEHEAGIAYAKIKAVYPKYTKEMLANSTIEELMRHAHVQNVLGGKREMAESDSMRFYKKLQMYVDSKEKTTGDKDKGSPKEMEYWPLIKVVRIYVKADALSTGAVIVDLPGVHDSNAARSAVAEGYMKQCTGLWIVAPINRAVDDKAAKSLLGETFKRQLKMDGGFNTVTFICSKTDDISLTEAQESLGLEEKMGALWTKSEEHIREKRKLKKQLEELKETRATYSAAVDEVDEQIETWESLKEDIDDGKTVYDPTDRSSAKKRKRNSSPESSPRKKRRATDSDLDSDYTDNDENTQDAENRVDIEAESQGRGAPLTTEQIEEKLSELKATKKENRRRKQDLEAEMKVLRKQMAGIEEADDKVHAEMSAIAISGRNEYSRGAIRQDFAAGVKELDQELAEEEDAEHFNPDVDARDYDEVAQSLPVFCVSSRGYQKLSGRFKKEATVPGFQTIEQTEIPQLQAHCKKLTEAGREATYRRFLNSLSQLLNSLRLWSSPDDANLKMTDAQKAKQASMVQDRFRKLDSDMEKHIKSVFEQIQDEFDDNIFDACETAISTARDEANETVLRWGAPVDRSNRAAGGYFWATYKAICRRNGVYSNAQGLHDWNAQLIEPVIKAIASGWEKTFSRRVRTILQSAGSEAASLLRSFHENIEKGSTRNGGSQVGLGLLSHHLNNYQQALKDLCNDHSGTITTEAKEINRMFQPVIAVVLEPAYEACTAERGSGSFMRMKHAMSAHVDHARSTMFRESVDTVKRALKKMSKSEQERMLEKIDQIIISVKRDYNSALFGSHLTNRQILPREQRAARNDVVDIIQESETTFKRLVGIEPEEDGHELEAADDFERETSTKQEEEPTVLPMETNNDLGVDTDALAAAVKAELRSDDDNFQDAFETLTSETNNLFDYDAE